MQNKAYYSLELAHPGDTGTAGEWNKRGNIKEMKEMFADFEHVLQKLINTVKEDDLLVWKLVQLPELEKWYSKYGRIVLLGDGEPHPSPLLHSTTVK
jgi:salicylate hydroxylase